MVIERVYQMLLAAIAWRLSVASGSSSFGRGPTTSLWHATVTVYEVLRDAIKSFNIERVFLRDETKR